MPSTDHAADVMTPLMKPILALVYSSKPMRQANQSFNHASSAPAPTHQRGERLCRIPAQYADGGGDAGLSLMLIFAEAARWFVSTQATDHMFRREPGMP